tara:strand:- start:1218 stop:2717 length:1500 start_codon:yes stop_codon:yes gene_type:complete
MFKSPFLDPFHTGEYFVQLINIENSFNSFSIHGAVNYVPAFLSRIVFGDAYILPTSIFINIIAIASSLLLAYICWLLLKGGKNRSIISLFIFSISLSFISHRDLLLMLSILYFIKLLHLTSFHEKINTIHLILFGLVMSLTIFWTFDRGIAGVVSIGTAYLYFLYQSKDYRLTLPIVSFIISIIILSVTFNPTSIFHWFDNVLMLASSSSQWHYPLSLSVFLFTSLAFIFFLFTVLNTLKQTKIENSYIFKTHLIFVFLLSLFLFRSAIDRADISHILLTLIGVFLIISLILGRESKIYYPFVGARFDFIVVLFICSVLVVGLKFKNLGIIYSSFLFAFVFMAEHEGQNRDLKRYIAISSLAFFALISLFNAYKKYNEMSFNKVASSGVTWAAQTLSAHNEKCIFDLTNNGIINALSDLPTCTKYSYPVYAPYKDEYLLLKQLKENMPNFIVYSSSFWSYAIDGKSMAIRYPNVDTFIKANYTFSECKFDYCIKSRINF